MRRKEVPVFLLNGFLESGKSSLIKEIVENNENYHNNSTVIICCEQGEVEYDEEWCKKNEVHVEYVENQEDFTVEFFDNLDKKYKPVRFVIEYNAFFDWNLQEFPERMVIYQQITLIDSNTFQVMFNNMKQIFQTMVRDSSLVIFNRCENQGKNLGQYRRLIRGMTQQAQIAFEQADGRLSAMLDEDLPYDLSKDVIAFEEDIYPTWYVEVFDNYERYFNKTFKFKTFVRDVNDKTFVVGRQVMTCCANDIQFLGYEVINDTNVSVKDGDVIYLECEVKHEYSDLAGEEVVMLHAKGITKLPNEEEKVLNMN
ncbi:MAG: hypothetical protein K6B64_03115 [Acholeplasmatales bacterium]|nr:hypothetical protein [Acholeplasmatales bacterium]